MDIRKGYARLCITVGLFFLCGVPSTLATSGNVLRTQGLINSGGNLKAGYLLINEMRIYVDRTTQIMDDREKVIPATHLKPKSWVYVEIEKGTIPNTFRGKKIYLLPRYVTSKERGKFPFMK